MSETAPYQYHPKVEETIETSGIDAGRVKDNDLAHEVANVENERRDTLDSLRQFTGDQNLGGNVEEEGDREVDSMLKYAIARKAVESWMYDPNGPDTNLTIHNLTVAGMTGEQPIIDGTLTKPEVTLLTQDALKASTDYNMSQVTAAHKRNESLKS